MQKRPTERTTDSAPEQRKESSGPFMWPIPGMRAGWYFNPVNRAIMHSPKREAKPLMIGFAPKVTGLVTARSEDGKHNGIRYLLETIEGARLVTEDELDNGEWAGKIGMQKPSGRDAIQAFATIIRKQSMDTPEVPSRVYRAADGSMVMPEADAQEIGYRVTSGEEDAAKDFWSMAGYYAHEHPTTALMLGAAFAAPLLEYLGLPCIVVNLCGDGQCGKSTTQVCQACLFGSIRGDGQQLFRGWDTSKQGLPQLLREARFLPIFREEFSTLNMSLAHGEQLLSGIVGGAERTMGGQAGVVQVGRGRFHSMVGSSSNRPLRRPGQTEDLASRLYEVRGPFWLNVFVNADGKVVEENPEAEHLSQWIKRKAKEFAGWPFEWAIRAGMYGAENLDKLMGAHRRLAHQFGSAQGGVAGTVAGVHAAWVIGAQMLGEVIELPELADAAAKAARELLDDATVSAIAAHLPAGQILWDALDAARVAPAEFPDIARVPEILTGEMRSQIQGFTTNNELWVLPACIETIARKAEIENVSACLADMKIRKVLIPGDGRNDRKRISRTLRDGTNRLPQRMYCFSIEAAETAYSGPDEDQEHGQDQEEKQGQDHGAGQQSAEPGKETSIQGSQNPSMQGSLEDCDPAPTEEPATALAGAIPAQVHSSLATTETQVTTGQARAERPMSAPAVVPDLIGQSVAQAAAEHGGDVEAATAALVKRAIPDAMALLEACRLGGRYEFTSYPAAPDILKKKTTKGADQIWEARPKFIRKDLVRNGPKQTVTALDMNGAYLSALKTHLPIGALQHSTESPHNPRRSGVHLITPPEWNHTDLPNPMGDRQEPGDVWITEPTLRLLLRLSSDKYGRLCDAPVIHESWTSGSSENLLEKFRCTLRDAREASIAGGDEMTLEYVKAMYSKVVSTMGESNANHDIRRPDWMHIIRAQAFSNLWIKALKAHQSGLTIVKMAGTDELHVVGNWQEVFPEGRGVSQVKLKDEYEIGVGE
ncbi:DUF927 domain-containing protein [Streptomyces sp. H10-C2]|uniref:DUF927 domain-containing protein n=1 Tax=Streptomyces sp. H10-C2 TaxID=3046210 RepID=UPI0024B990F5|nr:DUF927 domain-containing protein [Streptomyces sp. H10-C2]MDJ0375481.1 DUF927 domain-containing protein [Streptomyces sp. H10-C2]